MDLSKTLADLINWATGQPVIVALYLYGSQAEGHANALSDIDIGVLVQREIARESLWRMEDRWAATWLDRVDLRVINLAPLDFRYDVITRGERFWESDLEQVAEVESLIRRRYWDIKPLLDRDWAGFREALVERRSESERVEYQKAVAKIRAIHRRAGEASETHADSIS